MSVIEVRTIFMSVQTASLYDDLVRIQFKTFVIYAQVCVYLFTDQGGSVVEDIFV